MKDFPGPYAAPASASPGLLAPRTRGAWAVLASWGLALGSVGCALGAWSVGHRGPLGLETAAFGGTALGLAVGAIAYSLERLAAKRKPALLDGSGRWTRPLALWLIGAPLAFGAAGLVGLLSIFAQRSGSYVPALLVVVIAYAVIVFGRPMIAGRRLGEAVERMELGEVEVARVQFESVEATAWAPERIREMAAMNLGLIELLEGRYDQAASWYGRGGALRGRALAATGLAMVRVLQGAINEAEVAVNLAIRASDASAARSEIDVVRLFLSMRRDPVREAVKLSEALWTPGAGGLFLALRAAAYLRSGDQERARRLASDPLVQEAGESVFGVMIEEIRELRTFAK